MSTQPNRVISQFTTKNGVLCVITRTDDFPFQVGDFHRKFGTTSTCVLWIGGRKGLLFVSAFVEAVREAAADAENTVDLETYVMMHTKASYLLTGRRVSCYE